LKVVEIIQGNSEFCRLLDNLQQEWRNDTFIHFDAKWDNCIVLESSAPGYARGLRIVDWELAGMGDAGWDVGSVFADYLSLWRSSVLLLEDRAPAFHSIDGQCRLERMQPAMRAFWRTYVKRMQHEPSVANDLLVRAARFGAVRLLQIAVERAQRPIEAIVHLFGIRLSASS
jgi:thiamine kinase-like enzyme